MMTTELVLLFTLYATIIFGAFTGELGPRATFRDSGPKLAAKIEKNLATGRGFVSADGTGVNWEDL